MRAPRRRRNEKGKEKEAKTRGPNLASFFCCFS
jgi:hypothetical protein